MQKSMPFPIFPVRVWHDGMRWCKKPLISEWQHNKQCIWDDWPDDPEIGIGYIPWQQGLVGIDVDAYKGVDDAFLAELVPTQTHGTPSGGRHYLYRCDEPYTNSPGSLPAHVDIRCASGFFLWPGAAGYTVVDETEPQPLPDAIKKRLQSRERKEAIGEYESRPEWQIIQRLCGIEPECSYDTWIRVLGGIKGSGGDVVLADRWSAGEFHGKQPSNYTGKDSIECRWAGLDGRAGYATLCYLSKPKLEPGRETDEWWLARDLPQSEQLIGPLNTSRRMILTGATGAGKTQFALALAASVAAGMDLMHWVVPQSRRVMYVDGEMPRSMMRRRLSDAVHRCSGATGRLVLLNMADHDGCDDEFPPIPPLNEIAGQVALDAQIEKHRPDFIIFDNVAALTVGNQRETDIWSALSVWQRKITNKGIAQLWVVHANEQGKMYGDQTRAWHVDTVMNMVSTEDESCLAFDLTFSKKREYEPGFNDTNYECGRVKLEGNVWRWQAAVEIEKDKFATALAHGLKMTAAELARAVGFSSVQGVYQSKVAKKYRCTPEVPAMWQLASDKPD